MNPRLTLFALAACASSASSVAAQSRTLHIHSKILGEERTIHVNLPPSYSVAKQRYQVIYVLDGHLKAFVDLATAAAGYDISTGGPHEFAMPPQIVVGVEQKQRGVDLGTNQIAFDRFLAEELVPYIDKEFRTVPYRTLIGHSLGGRFALYTFCRNPGMFPAVVAISPGVGDSAGVESITECLRRDFAANHTVLRQLVLSAGDREGRLFENAMKLRDFVRDSAPSNWRLHVVDGAGLGHTDTPFTTIPAGINFVQSAAVWEMPPAEGDSVRAKTGADAGQRVTDFYKALSARVGYSVAPSDKWLRSVVAAELSRGEYAKGLSWAQRLTDAYPEDIVGWGVLVEACLRNSDNACARRALEQALTVVDRVDFYNEDDRAARKKELKENLARIP